MWVDSSTDIVTEAKISKLIFGMEAERIAERSS